MKLKNTTEVVELIKKKTNHNVLALFLSGSKLNKLNTLETPDTDYIAIVHDLAIDILHNKTYSHQFIDTLSNENKVDIKVYDTRKLLNLIEKSNFNLLETFNQKPIWTDDSNLGKEFYKDDFVKLLNDWNLNNLIRSSKGFVDSKLYARKRNKIITTKEFIQAIKCRRYVKQSMQNKKWDVTFESTSVFGDDYDFNKINLLDLKKENNAQKYQRAFEIYLQKTSADFKSLLDVVNQEKCKKNLFRDYNKFNLGRLFATELASDLQSEDLR